MHIKRTPALISEIIRLDEQIWAKYHPDYQVGSMKMNPNNIEMCLQADIESIFSDADNITEVYNDIYTTISKSSYGDDIMSIIDIDKAKNTAEIRRDFGKALSEVKRGCDLSSELDWGFSEKDLINLTMLHKSNKYRKKIEDLLEDCNFHYECGMLNERRYDELLKELKEA